MGIKDEYTRHVFSGFFNGPQPRPLNCFIRHSIVKRVPRKDVPFRTVAWICHTSTQKISQRNRNFSQHNNIFHNTTETFTTQQELFTTQQFPHRSQHNRSCCSATCLYLWLLYILCRSVFTGVCGQGMSNVFAAPPIKYFKIFFRLSIPKHNPILNLKP